MFYLLTYLFVSYLLVQAHVFVTTLRDMNATCLNIPIDFLSLVIYGYLGWSDYKYPDILRYFKYIWRILTDLGSLYS